MASVSSPTSHPPNPVAIPVSSGHDDGDRGNAGRALLFDITGIDLSARIVSREQIERYNPHRHEMSLLDWVVWHEKDFTRGIGLKHIRHDEFWVRGHFPGRPMYPGVLMIETAAQLASFMYNSRFTEPKLPVFARIEGVSFRAPVHPGDDFFVLCRDVKFTAKRFVTDIQGMVNGRAAFEARITGFSGGRFTDG
jgi:3-hydroxyacyl-[acyl-carrier-protein] dehydratase